MIATQRFDALPNGYELHAYRLERVLGSGAFGITYLALHGLLNSRHVIKEYLPDNALRAVGTTVRPKSEQDREIFDWGLSSFFEEARLLNRLSHPSVVKVTDLFKANDTAYFVMPYIEGQTLHAWMRARQKPSRQELEDLFVPLLEGLKYIHEQGLLHRDIKPENVFINKNGHPVLIDFGAARQAIGMKSRALTQLLTPHFAPFEQYASTGNFGPPLDIYSLACCICQAISRQLPLEAPQRVESDDQPKLTENAEYLAAYGHDFLAAVDKAMSVRAADRFQNAFEFQKALLSLSDTALPETAKAADVASHAAAAGQKDAEGKKAAAASGAQHAAPERESPAATAGRGGLRAKCRKAAKIILLALGVLALLLLILVGIALMAGPEPEDFNAVSNLAEKGNPSAQARLANMYRFGLDGAPKDAALAAQWFRKAAEQGNQDGEFGLGLVYHMGLGVEKDYAEAAKWYGRAVDQGSRAAQNNLGSIYSDGGYGVKQDHAKAVELFRKAAEKGDASAQANLGDSYAQGRGVDQDPVQAVYWYRKAAEQGHAIAMNNLGAMYRDGEGVEQNDATAAEWFRKAAEQGNVIAMNNLGIIHRDGKGVEQNYATAAEWFRKAAEQGHAGAQVDMGWLHEFGHGVEKDTVQAVYWYRKAAEQGHNIGQANLGSMYLDGEGVEQNYAKAAEWFRKAAEQGNALAQVNLGWMYGTGAGEKKDYAQAVHWYLKAAEQGNATGQSNLGIMYREGKGVEKDYAQATQWFLKAAEQGNKVAQENLAGMYERGEGVPKNAAEAKKWRQKAKKSE